MQEEARVGASPVAADTNAALVALSRAARSFLLYDPRNAAVRSFLEDLRRKTNTALGHGPMTLEVRPFELALRPSGEVVYLERDRERSLAFRMFRDGVRGLTINPAVEWDEVLKLLEVLSIRYTGVRQQEDDIVTLLWKAGFKSIAIEAVEGFVPDEEMPESVPLVGATATATGVKRHLNRVAFPRDRDRPLPPALPPAYGVTYRALRPEDHESLREEDSSRVLGRDVVRVVTEMLAVIADPTDPTVLDDLLPFLGEARGFLLAEGQLKLVVELVRALRSAAVENPEQMHKVLEGFADMGAIAQILHSVPHGSTTAPTDLVDLLDEIPADHLTHLIDLLSVERGDGSRAAMRHLISRYAPRRAGYVTTRIREAEPSVARDILKACQDALPEESLQAALDLSRTEDDALARLVLDILEKAPRKIEVSRALQGMLTSPAEEVRMEAAEVIARRHEQTGFDAIRGRLDTTGALEPSPQEASAYGRAMVKLSAPHALEVMTKWVRPPGMLSRLMSRTSRRTLLFAAVSGLEQLPGEESDKLIREVMARGDEELRKHCFTALSRRRRAGEAAAPGATKGPAGPVEVVSIPQSVEAPEPVARPAPVARPSPLAPRPPVPRSPSAPAPPAVELPSLEFAPAKAPAPDGAADDLAGWDLDMPDDPPASAATAPGAVTKPTRGGRDG